VVPLTDGFLAAVLFLAAPLAAQIPPSSDTLSHNDSAVTAGIPVVARDLMRDSTAQKSSCAAGDESVHARRVAAGAVFVGGNAALYSYFKRAWWSGTKAKHFFFRADWDEDFRDQDKFGHMFGGYQLTRLGDALLRGACASKAHALLWSAAYAAAFQLQIEIYDGMYQKYGFSYADLIANTTGMAFAVAQGAEGVAGDDALEAVTAATDGWGADVVIDAAGFEATWALGLQAIRPGGHIFEIGLGAPRGMVDFFTVLGKEATITGSYAWSDQDFARSLELLAGGALAPDGWLTRVPLADGQGAFEDLADRGRPFKVLLELG